MKKGRKIIIPAISIIILLSILAPAAALAQEKAGYSLLSPLPNIGGETGASDFSGYFGQMFRLAIGLAAIFAVFFMVVGGIQYMSTDAWTGKKEGMTKIKNAFWGLVLVLASWLILNTINPDLVGLKLNTSPAKVEVSAPVSENFSPDTLGVREATATDKSAAQLDNSQEEYVDMVLDYSLI